MNTTPFPAWVWWGSLTARIGVAVTALIVSTAIFAADVLFPQPLHLTRRIEDPVSQSVSTIHEYCAGNRVVTVNGDRVAIADYAKQELTEIDRAAGTYSVTSFADLANATASPAPRTASAQSTRGVGAAAQRRWNSTPLGVKSSATGRSIDAFELTIERGGGERVKIEVGVDRNVPLSRAAVEVLIGASFPNVRRDEHDAILEAAGARRTDGRVTTNAAGGAAADHALPVEQVTSYEVGSERITLRNAIVDVRSELPPDDVLTIPPGATRVESRAVRLARELRELDQLPSAPQQP